MRTITKTDEKKAFSILIVDDELGIQDFLKRALTKIYGLHDHTISRVIYFS
jgi:hypothetical protein